MNLLICNAMLFENRDQLILVGTDPEGYWIKSEDITSVDFNRGIVRDAYGCRYQAAWAPPEFELSGVAFEGPLSFSAERRLHRYKVVEWQHRFGCSVSAEDVPAQIESWSIIAEGPVLRLAGLLAGHPERQDGWGVTEPITHINLDANFVFTQGDRQRWHLGFPWEHGLTSPLSDLVKLVTTRAAAGTDVFVLDKHDVCQFRGRNHVLRS